MPPPRPALLPGHEGSIDRCERSGRHSVRRVPWHTGAMAKPVRRTTRRAVTRSQSQAVREYEAGYRRKPESRREIKAAEAAAGHLLSTVSW